MVDAIALATRAQNASADPEFSTFVSANAGSGKTTILTNRIARLLLAGNAPQSILCLTFTKAAAGEVQERIFRTLGDWVLMPSRELRAALAKIGEENVSEDRLTQARKLFAQALETPSGLKVQTIHAFSSSLLKRFPLEAGVPPNFRELDEAEAIALGVLAMGKVIEAEPDLASKISKRKNLGREFAKEILDARFGFRPDWQVRDFAAHFGRPEPVSPDAFYQEFLNYAPLDVMRGWCANVDHHSAKAFDKLQASLENGQKDLSLVWGLIHTGKGEIRKKVPAPEAKFVSDEPNFAGLVDLILRTNEPALDYQYFSALSDLHKFASLVLEQYAGEKSQRLVLDYDDLIERTDALLNENDRMNWVMYRLDGAISHILVDEAQDTNAAQWRIIDALAGAVAEDAERARTLFVVGDEKQSIYSFQGADPDVFEAKRVDYRGVLSERGEALREEELLVSFRSSPLILDFVDKVFESDLRQGLGPHIEHHARAENIPGRIEILPYRFKDDAPEKIAFPEIGVVPQASAELVLAEDIAQKIADDLQSGRQIEDGGRWRSVRPGDYLILLRKRKSFFYAVQKALQEKGIPIAGVDSLTLNDELAVRDILALLKALQAPFDDLSLACFLRSPLGGMSEKELYEMAHERGETSLLSALKARREDYLDVVEMIEDLQSQVDFLRPHDLIARLLYHHEGAAKLRARLGVVVEDVLQSLLDVAISYEGKETPSLAGFLAWFERQDLTLKRPLGEATGAVRTMTVHGAKGLEAPIVVLPMIEDGNANDGSLIEIDNVNLSKGSYAVAGASIDAMVKAKQAKREEEDHRLLYVALTRARSELLICGAGKPKAQTRDEFPDKSVYPDLIAAAEKIAGRNFAPDEPIILSHEWVDALGSPEIVAKPDLRRIEFEPFGEDIKAAPVGLTSLLADYVGKEGRGQQFGILFHDMMETLPRWNEGRWLEFARLRWGELPQFEEAFAEACLSFERYPRLLEASGLRELEFVLDVQSQKIAGRVDHILLDDDPVIVDYKTNLDVAQNWTNLHRNYQMQLAVYREAVRVATGETLKAAIFWSAEQIWLEASSAELDEAYGEFCSFIKK